MTECVKEDELSLIPTYRGKRLVRERDSFKCVECGITEEDYVEQHGHALDVHRKMPGVKGGQYTLDNCVTLCRACHGAKHRQKESKKEMWALKLDKELLEYARDAKYWARFESLTEMFEKGLKKVIEEAEGQHNKGKKFPPRPKKEGEE